MSQYFDIFILEAFWKMAIKRVIDKGLIREEEISKIPTFKYFTENYIFEDKEVKINLKKIPAGENSKHAPKSRPAIKTKGFGYNKKQMCMARVCNGWRGGQCKRYAKENDLCAQHLKIFKQYSYLKFGRIDEKRVNRHINPKNMKEEWIQDESKEENLISF